MIALCIRGKRNAWGGRGPRISVHKDQQEAEAALAKYVRANWDTEVEMAETDDDDDVAGCPEDDGTAIEEYFGFTSESYAIVPVVGGGQP